MLTIYQAVIPILIATWKPWVFLDIDVHVYPSRVKEGTTLICLGTSVEHWRGKTSFPLGRA